jgi:predicted PurR-regulated permease PerM
VSRRDDARAEPVEPAEPTGEGQARAGDAEATVETAAFLEAPVSPEVAEATESISPAGEDPPPEAAAATAGADLQPTETDVDPEDADSPLVRADGRIRWRYLAWAVGSLSAVVAFIWLLTAVQTVAVPFLVAFILAYILDPVVDRFEARGISRSLAIGILLTVSLLVGTLVLVLVGPQLVAEFAEVPGKLRGLLATVVPWVEGRFDVTLPRTVDEFLTSVQNTLAGWEVATLTAPARGVLTVLMDGAAGVLGFVIAVLLIPVFLFFLLRDFDRIVEGVRDLVPARYRPSVVARFREIDGAMSGFIRGQLTVAAILSVLYSVGLLIVGLPLALVVGVIAGLGNMVPYVGTAIGLILATLMAFLDWQGWGTLLAVYAVFAIVQTLESWVFTPRIVGDSVGLSPFLVIVAVMVFGELFGFVGILVAVPLAAIVKILLRVSVEEYRRSPFFRG